MRVYLKFCSSNLGWEERLELGGRWFDKSGKEAGYHETIGDGCPIIMTSNPISLDYFCLGIQMKSTTSLRWFYRGPPGIISVSEQSMKWK